MRGMYVDTTRLYLWLMMAFRYGAHLSTDEVQALVAPHPDSVEIVDSWLAHHEVDLFSVHRSGGGDWITLRISVAQAERMLGKYLITACSV
jgi:hypothetical protein